MKAVERVPFDGEDAHTARVSCSKSEAASSDGDGMHRFMCAAMVPFRTGTYINWGPGPGTRKLGGVMGSASASKRKVHIRSRNGGLGPKQREAASSTASELRQKGGDPDASRRGRATDTSQARLRARPEAEAPSAGTTYLFSPAGLGQEGQRELEPTCMPAKRNAATRGPRGGPRLRVSRRLSGARAGSSSDLPGGQPALQRHRHRHGHGHCLRLPGSADDDDDDARWFVGWCDVCDQTAALQPDHDGVSLPVAHSGVHSRTSRGDETRRDETTRDEQRARWTTRPKNNNRSSQNTTSQLSRRLAGQDIPDVAVANASNRDTYMHDETGRAEPRSSSPPSPVRYVSVSFRGRAFDLGLVTPRRSSIAGRTDPRPGGAEGQDTGMQETAPHPSETTRGERAAAAADAGATEEESGGAACDAAADDDDDVVSTLNSRRHQPTRAGMASSPCNVMDLRHASWAAINPTTTTGFAPSRGSTDRQNHHHQPPPPPPSSVTTTRHRPSVCHHPAPPRATTHRNISRTPTLFSSPSSALPCGLIIYPCPVEAHFCTFPSALDIISAHCPRIAVLPSPTNCPTLLRRPADGRKIIDEKRGGLFFCLTHAFGRPFGVRTRCSRHIQVRLVCTVSACTLSMRVRCTQRRRPSQATARHPTKAGRRSSPPSAPPLARASSSHDGPTRVPQARPSAPPPSCGARQTKTMDKATDRDLDLENARACPPPMLRVMWRRRTYVDRRCASLSSSFRPTSQARTRRGAIMPLLLYHAKPGRRVEVSDPMRMTFVCAMPGVATHAW
ncbi:hypothetical protein Purlil1_7853 [Purpureocillium lilacinum]|uniref:Uncharacterized protein n=1 Tax=Purpureocillium lilacinum TaxID=33203 RepID=A0ABR0BVI2_PURLI|nr:hypothetical protein Purlil1_7853 [Purpureocillium lilacinum]